VCLPAIAETDETQTVDTVWGAKRLTRRQGEGLHAAREPLSMLEQIRRTIGEYNFADQYQQAPSPLGGGLVKAGWFRHYAVEDVPQFERTCRAGTPRARRPSSAISACVRARGYRARTSTCSTYCASAWNTRS